MLSALLSLWLCLFPHLASAGKVDTRVDERIELVSIVARLAGLREYRMQNSDSAYARRVEAHFGPHRDHPAVRRLVSLHAERGVSYDALPSLALHLGPLPDLVERVSFEAAPERLDARWNGAAARPFLVDLRDFARATGAAEFFASERAFYSEVSRRLSERLSESRALPWFDDYFGARPGASCVAIAGLLCGGMNYGVGVRFADGRAEELAPVFGCWEWDEQGFPKFGASYVPLFAHELCHSYTNRLVDAFERELAAPAARIHASCADAMKRQGYSTPKIVMYETLVRACVVRCRLATEGSSAAKEQAQAELEAHFAWVPELADLFAEYEKDRDRFPTLRDFLPRIVERLTAIAERLPEDARAPQVVALVPANAATDVDPMLTLLRITFDRPMRDQSWSLVGAKSDLPEITGALSYDAARKVLTVPIRLQPDRTYSFSLNGERHKGFVSAEGVALEPLPVRFSTRAR